MIIGKKKKAAMRMSDALEHMEKSQLCRMLQGYLQSRFARIQALPQ